MLSQPIQSVAQELDRKTNETLDWIDQLVTNGDLTPDVHYLLVQVLFSVTGGLVTKTTMRRLSMDEPDGEVRLTPDTVTVWQRDGENPAIAVLRWQSGDDHINLSMSSAKGVVHKRFKINPSMANEGVVKVREKLSELGFKFIDGQ